MLGLLLRVQQQIIVGKPSLSYNTPDAKKSQVLTELQCRHAQIINMKFRMRRENLIDKI